MFDPQAQHIILARLVIKFVLQPLSYSTDYVEQLLANKDVHLALVNHSREFMQEVWLGQLTIIAPMCQATLKPRELSGRVSDS